MSIKQPRKVRFSHLEGGTGATAEFSFPDNFADDMNALHADAQEKYDIEFFNLSKPKMPFDTGVLQKSSQMLNTTLAGTGIVAYAGPSAHYLHEGILYVDPIYGVGAFHSEDYGFWSRPGVAKVPSDRLLEYQGAPERGAHWTDRTWDEHKDHFENIVAEVYRKGGY